MLGASGRTGRAVVDAGVRHGSLVTAVVRRQGLVPLGAGVVEALVPAPGVSGALDAALAGHDAVISALGPRGRGPSTVCADGARSALGSMARTGVRRLVVVSAHAVGESRDRSPYSLFVWALVGDKMRDKEAMEALVRASDLDWTLVRPPGLSDGATTLRYRTGEGLRLGFTSTVTRADLADFLVREAGTGEHAGRAVGIAA